jgi:hypothetical protein
MALLGDANNVFEEKILQMIGWKRATGVFRPERIAVAPYEHISYSTRGNSRS